MEIQIEMKYTHIWFSLKIRYGGSDQMILVCLMKIKGKSLLKPRTVLTITMHNRMTTSDPRATSH